MNSNSAKILLIIVFLKFSPVIFSQNSRITLQEVWKDGYFVPKSINLGRSMNDGVHYSIVEQGSKLSVYSYETGQIVREVFTTQGSLEAENGRPQSIGSYHFNADETSLLVGVNRESIYRRSYSAEYYVYNISRATLTALSGGTRQTLPEFSPDGKMIAFVRDNNLLVNEIETGNEFAVTTDGEFNKIINGTTDWVYEEEFGFTKGFQWSPDSRKIAFLRFDEEHVREFTMVMYGELYPELYKFKYPKAGEDNSKVSLNIFDLQTKKTIAIDTGTESERYIPRFTWTKDPNLLAVVVMNRHQNEKKILLANSETGHTSTLYHETNKYYTEISDDLTFLTDKKHFVISSTKSGFNHLYLYDMQGNEISKITQGDWDVAYFNGIDEKTNMVYFVSSTQSPMQRHLYRIKLDGTDKQLLTPNSGTNSPSFSKGFKFFINSHSNANTPPVISIHNSDGGLVKVLEDNKELVEKVTDRGFVEREFFMIETEPGVVLNAWRILPPDFDPKKKYPVLMYVYGGPGSQTVIDRWDAGNGPWHQMLAQMGFMIASVDNRGTGHRGEEFMKMTYMQLGKYETIDQINAARYLASLPYVNGDAITIFGWSYGGYLAALCLALGADIFSGAISVAPVTNWRFYDTIYTERYMRTPQENPSGYDDNSPINHVGKIKGKLLLAHGSADDNVHYQNTMEMANAMIHANIPFELAIYPNRNHGIRGGNARLHLFEHITRFLTTNWGN